MTGGGRFLEGFERFFVFFVFFGVGEVFVRFLCFLRRFLEGCCWGFGEVFEWFLLGFFKVLVGFLLGVW